MHWLGLAWLAEARLAGLVGLKPGHVHHDLSICKLDSDDAIYAVSDYRLDDAVLIEALLYFIALISTFRKCMLAVVVAGQEGA